MAGQVRKTDARQLHCVENSVAETFLGGDTEELPIETCVVGDAKCVFGKEFEKILQHLHLVARVLKQGGRNTGELDDAGCERNTGIDQLGKLIAGNAVLDNQRAHLDNTVAVGVGTSRFQIDGNYNRMHQGSHIGWRCHCPRLSLVSG